MGRGVNLAPDLLYKWSVIYSAPQKTNNFPFTALFYLICTLFHKELKALVVNVKSTFDWYLKCIQSHCESQPITPRITH